MELSHFLHYLNFPANFEQGLKRVELIKDSCSWPVMTAAGGSSVKEIEGFFHRPTIIALEDKLGLGFEAESMINGKVCFANTEEVQPDFRTTFSAGELLNYIFALFPATGYVGTDIIFLPFPEDIDQFWKLVGLGRKSKGDNPK